MRASHSSCEWQVRVGISGGWFGRGTVVTRRRVELVILLTPKIVAGVATQ